MKSTTQKSNTIFKNLHYYIIAVLCVTAFFAYEFFPTQSVDYVNAKTEFEKNKSKRTEALSRIKEEAKGSEAYGLYLVAKKETEASKLKIQKVKENDSFLGFDNIQQFLGEFGWIFGFFIYSLFNLCTTIRDKSGYQKGKILLNSTTLFIACYYLGWCFNIKQDFDTYWYVMACFLATILVSGAAYFILRTKSSYHLKISNLVNFILRIRKVYITDLAVKAMDSDEEQTINMILDFESETKDQLKKVVE